MTPPRPTFVQIRPRHEQHLTPVTASQNITPGEAIYRALALYHHLDGMLKDHPNRTLTITEGDRPIQTISWEV